jgi:hypothetical protein
MVCKTIFSWFYLYFLGFNFVLNDYMVRGFW